MKAFTQASWVLRRFALRSASHRRGFHGTHARYAITQLQMPAMSPTMTEGGIAQWKKKEGESFSAGEVLLEIETDKATIDVEAQDDGVMGKILTPDGTKNVSVGKVIAHLAEEGDDISNLEAPKEEPILSKQESAAPPPTLSPPASTPTTASSSPPSHSHTPPRHSRPLFPSVQRLLLSNNVSDTGKIKGTGVRGMLTKGDVLAFLGMASNPRGTDKQAEKKEQKVDSANKEEPKPLDGPALRRLIVSNFLQSSLRARNATPALHAAPDFDSIIADYLPSSPAPSPAPKAPLSPKQSPTDYLDGLI